MKVRIKRIDPSLPLPQYATDGAVAFDLCARTAVTIAPHGVDRVPCNVVIEVPPGYALILASRSSTPVRKGLLKANGVGIIDQDYCGDTDEIQALFYNTTDSPVTVERGERIAQALLVPTPRVSWEEVEQFGGNDRGGFGSTGV
jgi:dUTP pyrophosphatase